MSAEPVGGWWKDRGSPSRVRDDEIAEAVLAVVRYITQQIRLPEPTGAGHVLPDVASYVYERSA